MNYTVVMPVYNGRQYFETALSSAIEAVALHDEIIVVEDGSQDGGVEDIVASHSQRGNIRYFAKDNGGVASALNLGLKHADNDLFAWLSHDDVYLPSRLLADRALRKYSPDAVTVSNFYLFDDVTKQLNYINSVHHLSRNQRFRLLSRRFLNGNCLTVPISLLRAQDGFDESRWHTQDYAMWLQLLKQTSFVAIPEPTVLSRQHPEQDSKKEPQKARDEYVSLLNEHLTLKDVCDPRNIIDWLRIAQSVYG